MSWKDAIEDIVTEMETEIKSLERLEEAIVLLKVTAGRLKSVLKTAGDIPVAAPVNNNINPLLITPEIQRAAEVEKHRAEFRNKHSDKEEKLDGNLIEVVDGPDAPFYHPVDPGMEVGQRIVLPGGVYQLRRRDGVRILCFDEVSTEEAKAGKGKIVGEGGGIILGS